MGAIECMMASGRMFRIERGFTDRERQNPPKVGTIIVYKFHDYTKSMVPRYDLPALWMLETNVRSSRFPTYVGDAIDKTRPKDAKPCMC